MSSPIDLEPYRARVLDAERLPIHGKVLELVGLTIEATGPAMRVGDLCYVRSRDERETIPVEVVGFREGRILLMPLGRLHGIGPESLLIPTHQPLRVPVGEHLVGRVVNGLGVPLDGDPLESADHRLSLTGRSPLPLDRKRITEPVATGVRSIDSCLTCGQGQRIGILSGSGVGKSKLSGMIARNTDADVNVIALIGERGREVKDFVEVDLGYEGLRRSVVVAATSDDPALVRIKGAYLATAIAEWFRDQGNNVMLMMDSVTRFAMAQREVGLAIGEPPTTKGYPPSVFALLPQLLERAGATPQGSITGFYSVLVEADDINDPVGDAVRSIVDGHIVLSRDLASRGHFPAVDVLESVSRVMRDIVDSKHVELAQQMRSVLATYRDAEDLVNIGAYVAGSNPEIDHALDRMPKVRKFLQQGLEEACDFKAVVPAMRHALN